MRQPDACIVCITDAEGNTLGTGFLVSADGRIATCHHVVKETKPCVVFPGGKPRKAQIITSDPTHDVAILKLEGGLPTGAGPARLGYSAEGHYSDFRSRGCRPMGEMQGIPAEGRVLHAVSDCLGASHMPLILKSQDIRKGMSGAPVYIPDLDRVVGMITGYWDSLKAETGFRDAESGFAVPSEAITTLCPDIPIHQPSPRFQRPLISIPFQAPALPRYFVARPEVSNELKDCLLADEAIAPGALVVSAVHGLGGIGKTTLVAALAHDPEMQARFPDGILWVTLGHEPDVLSLLAGWIQALRDYGFRPIVIDSASSHLRTLLHDKTCLLVVDDAWRTEHVRPFLVGGDHCRVLVTTRDATLARKLGAHLYDLEVVTEAQALALFQARLGSLSDDREQAAAQVEEGYSWTHLLDTFRHELADLAALDLDEATYRNESLRLSFRLSLEWLLPDDQKAFIWLGILPEDACLNPIIAATLWDQPEAEAHKRLRRLSDRALLKSIGENHYIVHDLLHDEAKLRLAEKGSLPEAHAILLERYRARTRNGMWHTLSDDGYVHERLTWHMVQAEWREELHLLLQEESCEHRNGWFEARERLEQTEGYLLDIARAAQLAHEDFMNSSRVAIGLQCRYALIKSSIATLACRHWPGLAASLVDLGIWPPSQALAYVKRILHPEYTAYALAALAPFLPEVLLPKALELAEALPNGEAKEVLMLVLCDYLPQPLLGRVATMEFKWLPDDRDRVLAALGCQKLEPTGVDPGRGSELEQAEWEEVLALSASGPWSADLTQLQTLMEPVETIGDGQVQASDFLKPRSYSPRSQLRADAEQIVRELQAVQSEPDWILALTNLTPHVAHAEPMRAFCAVLALSEARWESKRIRLIAKLVPFLPRAQRLRVWQEELARIQEMEQRCAEPFPDESYPGTDLVKIIRYLPRSERRQAWHKAESVTRKGRLVSPRVFGALIPCLPAPERMEAWSRMLTMVRETRDGEILDMLTGLIPFLPESERLGAWCEVLALVAADRFSLKLMMQAVGILVGKIACLPVAQRVEAFREILAVKAQAQTDEWRLTLLLMGSIPHLPQAERDKALKELLWTGEEIADTAAQSETLAGLEPHKLEQSDPESDGPLLWDQLTWRSLERTGTELLRLPDWLATWWHSRKTKELAAFRATQNVDKRADWLEGLSCFLQDVEFMEVVREAWAEVWKVDDYWGSLDPEEQSADLAKIAPALLKLPLASLYLLWRETLPVIAVEIREYLLAYLTALAPIIARLGGSEAINETMHAIQDVGRWWP